MPEEHQAETNTKLQWENLDENQKREELYSFAEHPRRTGLDFLQLVQNEHGVYASTGPHFQYAVFGRDSIEVAEDLLEYNEVLARTIILELAAKQGTHTNQITEEEPGKIHHEFRAEIMEGERIPDSSMQHLQAMRDHWGGETYYGSYDATPLFVRLIGHHVDMYGKDILSEPVIGKDGETHSLAESMRRATQWLIEKLETSQSGLLEYSHMNPKGLLNQTWKDSVNSYLFSDGTMANWEKGIASTELQGYAYDALIAAAEHVAASPDEARTLKQRAQQLQQTTLKSLWMPRERFFAQGLDYDQNGNSRQIDTITSNGALLLDSRLLVDLPSDVSASYVEDVISRICSNEFITPYGIRCRSLQQINIPNSVGYHSSYAVWPKETYDIARGLKKHGFSQLAEALGNTIITGVVDQAEFWELFYFDEQGRYRTAEQLAEHIGRELLQTEEIPVPEPGQAWTISAFTAQSLSRYDRIHSHELSAPLEHMLASRIVELTID
jgi:glycogen debranching enzyme